MSNSLDPDRAQHFVGLNLEPIYLQRLSDDTSKQTKLLKIMLFFLLRVIF